MNKYNLSGIFSDLNSESSVILPKSIKIKSIKNLDTISDATSSFIPQKGGYLNNNKNRNINKLLSMLSATSESYYTANSTDNAKQLKNKLLNKVQVGGSELINIFTKLYDIVITLYVKSEEEWKRLSVRNIDYTKPDTYETLDNLIKEIIRIFTSLPDNEKEEFLNFIHLKITSSDNFLREHPILFLIYNNIIGNNNHLTEITIRIILYNLIQKIFGNYLTTKLADIPQDDPFKNKGPLDEEEISEQFKFVHFLEMLKNIRNDIEAKLMVIK